MLLCALRFRRSSLGFVSENILPLMALALGNESGERVMPPQSTDSKLC